MAFRLIQLSGMIVIFFSAFALGAIARRARKRSADLAHDGCASIGGCAANTNSPAAEALSIMRLRDVIRVRCSYRTGDGRGFLVRCYNTTCPHIKVAAHR